jgi:hypothetical protein
VIFRHLASALLIVILCSSAFAQDNKKSTPEERQQWADTLHKLEAHPEDAAALKAAGHALDRLIEVDDVTIAPCAFKEFPANYKPFKPILFYTLALSAYQVETHKDDAIGSNVYAIRSVLKAYSSELATNPKAHDKKLDHLAQLDTDGQLAVLIEKDGCKK